MELARNISRHCINLIFFYLNYLNITHEPPDAEALADALADVLTETLADAEDDAEDTHDPFAKTAPPKTPPVKTPCVAYTGVDSDVAY